MTRSKVSSFCSLRFALNMASLVTLFALLVPATRLAAQDLTVNYTGRLFGYYRIEAAETVDHDPYSYAFVTKLKLVENFLNRRTPGSDLLLGMGDNFAPEFGAAIQQEFRSFKSGSEWTPCRALAQAPTSTEDLKQRKHFAPESLYKSEFRLPAMADCDNVTRFLMTAGYRAIVPGREDFIYTGTWLRRIAALMKGASKKPPTGKMAPNDDNPVKIPKYPSNSSSDLVEAKRWKSKETPIVSIDNKLHMLAANLRVIVTDPDAKESETSCPLFFAEDIATKVPCVDKGKAAVTEQMNWLQRIDESLQVDSSNRPVVDESLQRQAKTNAEFNKQLIKNQLHILKAAVRGEMTQLEDETIRLEREINLERETDIIDQKLIDGDGQQLNLVTDKLKTLQNISDFTDCIIEPEKGEPKDDSPKKLDCSKHQQLPSNPPSDAQDIFEIAKKLQDFAKRPSPPTSGLGDVLLSQEFRRKMRDRLLGLIYKEQENVGFTIADMPQSNKRALVIGVVGTETMQEISPDYFTVIPDDWDCNPLRKDTADIACRNKPEREVKGGVLTTKFPPTKNHNAKPFNLAVGDPRLAVATLLRAAWAKEQARKQKDPTGKRLFDFVIVMAQMPRTEADELGAHVRGDIEQWYTDNGGLHLYVHCNPSKPTDPCIQKDDTGIYYRNEGKVHEQIDPPSIDLILSEAQDGHQTPTMEIGLAKGEETPVLTPADVATPSKDRTADPVSIATLSDKRLDGYPHVSQVLSNTLPKPTTTSSPSTSNETAAARLYDSLITALKPSSDFMAAWSKCPTTGSDSCQNTVLMQHLLRQLQLSAKADVVLLKRRDFYFGWLGDEYTVYDVCKQWAIEPLSGS